MAQVIIYYFNGSALPWLTASLYLAQVTKLAHFWASATAGPIGCSSWRRSPLETPCKAGPVGSTCTSSCTKGYTRTTSILTYKCIQSAGAGVAVWKQTTKINGSPVCQRTTCAWTFIRVTSSTFHVVQKVSGTVKCTSLDGKTCQNFNSTTAVCSNVSAKCRTVARTATQCTTATHWCSIAHASLKRQWTT